MAGVSSSTLRLWETQGLIKPERTESGRRYYSAAQVERLQAIQWFRRDRGLNPVAIHEHFREQQAPRDAPPTAPGVQVGMKFRHLRHQAGKTLTEVAQATGIAASTLVTFERTSQGLSLTALHRLAACFNTTLSVLNGQEERQGGESLVRHGQWSAWPATSSGVTVQVLSSGKNQMECHRFVLAPGASSEGSYQHVGEEFVHVLAGSLEIVLDSDQFFQIGAGDSFYFESTRPHCWRNTHAGETILIWINTPPSF